MAFADRHEEAIAWAQPVGHLARRHLQLAVEQPDMLGHAMGGRMRGKADAGASGEFDFDDIDVGGGAGCRDRPPEITGLRIAPDLLLLPTGKRRGLLPLLREEGRQ